MNIIFKKFNSAYSRIKNGFQVALFPEKFYLYNKYKYLYHSLSYSLEGEDMIISRFFTKKANGFYVDVGAHHPQRFSNTYRFYLQGWRGINIDPMPGSMDLFNQLRPRDINLEIAISEQREILTYYKLNDSALNGFCDKLSKEREKFLGCEILASLKMPTQTLTEVLDKYLPPNQDIDFLSVDVEGLDLQVLKSNNWQRYRPLVVLAEDLNRFSLQRINESKVVSFMNQQDYQLYAKSVNTLIFTEIN
ncbi:MAG: FkbM family methyltransferase [Coleofasciculus sp. A1-SPW-01]|uniref:FkbM family methyltransferase n=1 Tax=Coleofasciculus sp. A1-SPW-01 TaxID=3070819 RepID=UPI0032F76B68